MPSLVGSEMCIRDSFHTVRRGIDPRVITGDHRFRPRFVGVVDA